MVEEAHVLAQRRIVEAGEGADERVGGDDPAHQIAVDGIGDRATQWALDQRLPRRRRIRAAAVGHKSAGLPAPQQRLGHGRPQRSGQRAAAAVELGESGLVAGRPDRREAVLRSDQQAAAPAVDRIRGVGGVPPPGQPHPGTEIVQDARRQQADKIGVPGQPRVHAVEGPRRHRRAAHFVEPFQHTHPPARPGQVPGRHQSVVPAAHDDGIEDGHGGSLGKTATVMAVSAKPQIEFPEGPPPAELAIKDLVVGEGAEATAGAVVDVHYVGVEYDTGEEFDSSWDRGESISFPLRGLIQGWQDGIPGMRVGGRRQLIIPPEQAYGPAGGGHRLSGKTLIFVIDLLGTA